MKWEIIDAALKLYHARGRGVDYDFYVNQAVKTVLTLDALNLSL